MKSVDEYHRYWRQKSGVDEDTSTLFIPLDGDSYHLYLSEHHKDDFAFIFDHNTGQWPIPQYSELLNDQEREQIERAFQSAKYLLYAETIEQQHDIQFVFDLTLPKGDDMAERILYIGKVFRYGKRGHCLAGQLSLLGTVDLRPIDAVKPPSFLMVVRLSDMTFFDGCPEKRYFLTRCELKVLKLYAQDQDNKKIAKILFCSTSTVNNHLQNIKIRFNFEHIRILLYYFALIHILK